MQSSLRKKTFETQTSTPQF